MNLRREDRISATVPRSKLIWWCSRITSSIISNFSEGTYDILVQDANLCEISGSADIFNLPSPIIDFTINPDNQRLFDQLDDPIVFIDQTDGLWQSIDSWIWNFADGSFGSDSISFHSYSDTGTYIIILTKPSKAKLYLKDVIGLNGFGWFWYKA